MPVNMLAEGPPPKAARRDQRSGCDRCCVDMWPRDVHGMSSTRILSVRQPSVGLTDNDNSTVDLLVLTGVQRLAHVVSVVTEF